MKKKIVFLIIVMALVSIVLTGCSSKFDDISIDVNNVKDVKEGTYTLEYRVNNYEKYVNSLSLQVYIWVYDSENNSIEVANNRTIEVKKDETYTVKVTVTGLEGLRQRSISAMYTINAEDNLPLVSFILSDSDSDQSDPTVGRYDIYYREYSPLEKGGTLIYDSVVPTLNFSDTSSLEYKYYFTDFHSKKYTREVVGYKWVVYNSQGEEEVLTQEHLTNLNEDLQIYCIVKWSYTMSYYTITIDSNGGNTFSPITGQYGTVIDRIATPQKSGYLFLGWCKDEACTNFINWNNKPFIEGDATYYAAWEEVDEDTTAIDSFEFTKKVDSNGNIYYIIDGISELSGDIVLPNSYAQIYGDDEGVYPVSGFMEGAFMGNTNITSVYIPNTYTLIEDQAFYGCTGLTTLVFEETGSRMKQINANAFAGCTSLVNITFPSSLLRITTSAFNYCASLEEIVLPNSLTTIGPSAFASCTNLESITIPDSVITIGKASFANCTSLESVTISSNSSLVNISNDSFYHCFNLEEIYLPKLLEATGKILIRDPTAVNDSDKYITIKYH